MKRRAPKTLVEAKFSLPFLVAVAAKRRSLGLSAFSPNGLRSKEVLATARKVVPIEDRSLDWKLELPDGRVEIVMRDGRRFERTGADVPGSAENPLGWGEIVEKFNDCVSVAAQPLPGERIPRICELVQNLEKVEDATILPLLCSEH